MKSRLLPLLLGCLASLAATGQQVPFTQLAASLPPVSYSAAAWGDCDGDGDLDLALTGANGNTPVTAVYMNLSGTFSLNASPLLPLHFGSIEWADYDTDGDFDLLVTGITAAGQPHTILYRNNSGLFSDAGISLPGLSDGQAVWGDMDNDGDPDILMAGLGTTCIYRNDGNDQFTLVNQSFPALDAPMVAWNDYNNDGRSDVLVCGNTGGGIITSLYRNEGGTFSLVSPGTQPFVGLYGGQARWCDLDGDRDQDLVINGMDLYVDGYFLIYRNDGNDQFTKIEGAGPALLSPWFDLADYDCDGLTDIMVTGASPGCGGPPVSLLLKNEGNMVFSTVSTLIPGYKLGCSAWGDFNGDGFSDLVFTGMDEFDVPHTGLFLNNLGNTQFAAGTPPSAPAGLSANAGQESILLQWSRSTDGQTPQPGLTYNIRIGTQPGLSDILSPLASETSGARRIASPGNTAGDTSWIIRNIPAGSYYFSVQAIDAGFMGGAFSEPVGFSYSPAVSCSEPVGRTTFNVHPNPCRDFLHIETQGEEFVIMDLRGEENLRGKDNRTIDVRHWSKGVYFLRSVKNPHCLPVRVVLF